MAVQYANNPLNGYKRFITSVRFSNVIDCILKLISNYNIHMARIQEISHPQFKGAVNAEEYKKMAIREINMRIAGVITSIKETKGNIAKDILAKRTNPPMDADAQTQNRNIEVLANILVKALNSLYESEKNHKLVPISNINEFGNIIEKLKKFKLELENNMIAFEKEYNTVHYQNFLRDIFSTLSLSNIRV